MSDKYQAADNDDHRKLEELASQDGELGGRVDQVDEQLRETARVLRVEGIRGQAVGISLGALGLVLQTGSQVGM